MWLDDLDELVGMLERRINDHRHYLTKSESTTRYALIDPLLNKLGWALADPSQVLTEHDVSNEYDRQSRYVDYVMHVDKKPCLIIEAKSLGTPVRNGEVLNQASRYCNSLGVRHFVLTNGDHWEAHDKSLDGPLGRSPIFEFNVTSRSKNVMELLWLWPGNFEAAPIRPPVRSKLQPTSMTGTQKETLVPSPYAGRSLADYQYQTGIEPPHSVALPDGSVETISTWVDVQARVASWLIKKGLVTPPLPNRRGNYLIHSTPQRKDGKQFLYFRQVSGHYIDTHHDPTGHLRKAKEMMVACDQDPSQVTLNFRDT